MKTRVKNRARTLLTITMDNRRTLYIPANESRELTEKQFEHPRVQSLVKAGHLVVIPSVKAGSGKDARSEPTAKPKVKKQGGED